MSLGALGMVVGFGHIPFLKGAVARVKECRRLKALERAGRLRDAVAAAHDKEATVANREARREDYRSFAMKTSSRSDCEAACAADSRCLSFRFLILGDARPRTGSVAVCSLEGAKPGRF